MSDLVYWTLFLILVLLLVVLTVKLCYRVIRDVWCSNPELSEDAQDIQYPTRYRNDFRTIGKDAQVKDESDKLIMTKEFTFKDEYGTTPTLTTFTGKAKDDQMQAIAEEEDDSKSNEAKIEAEEERVKEEEETMGEKEKDGDEKIQTEELAIEDLEPNGIQTGEEKDRVDGEEKENFTDEEKKILKKIIEIQGDTDTCAKKIPFCLGGRNHLTYYDINEKFLRNLIELSSVDCKDNDKLKKRKQLVSMYIQECQNELKKRADVDVP